VWVCVVVCGVGDLRMTVCVGLCVWLRGCDGCASRRNAWYDTVVARPFNSCGGHTQHLSMLTLVKCCFSSRNGACSFSTMPNPSAVTWPDADITAMNSSTSECAKKNL
jgi:hypothetical protein